MSEMLRFCADVHLGKLARRLRMFGFDTVYENNLSKEEFVAIAKKGDRILLSKDSYFRRFPEINFFRIDSSDPEKQVKAVISHYQLLEWFHPFSRCLDCNGAVEEADLSIINGALLPDTKAFYSEFRKCQRC